MGEVLAIIGAAAWVYLICARGRFWACPVTDRAGVMAPKIWPAVAVVVPARNEAAVIAQSLRSLLRQDYPGRLNIVVVNDDSEDDTASIVTNIADEARGGGETGRSVTVLSSGQLPSGWTGKLWALRQGIAAVDSENPDYLLLTDADIVHAPDTLSWLVAKASGDSLVLTSVMARLRCASLAERIHVPAFVYFFQMLFPFAWVCHDDREIAAAAGGCMLIRRDALHRAGGIASIRNALIDDCSLAAKLKAVGPIWLGLTNRVHSIRAYDTFADIRQMISRSAYAQLRYSPVLLGATLLAMIVVFVAPPLLFVFANSAARYLGLAAWLAMAISFQPTLRFYRLSPLWGFALPAIAGLYAFYTACSAYAHFRRRGGQWKGRIHVNASSLP